MKLESGQWYHIYNRGNNSQPIFFYNRNYQYFLRKMGKHLKPHCDVVAYCLMPNHFHWLVRVNKTSSITRLTAPSGLRGVISSQNQPLIQGIATLLSSYTQGINKQENRKGSLFQQKTKAKSLVDSTYDYLTICFHYIHQNPLQAGFVKDLKDWPYSSYPVYPNIRKDNLVNINLGFRSMRINHSKDFIKQTNLSLDPDMVAKLE